MTDTNFFQLAQPGAFCRSADQSFAQRRPCTAGVGRCSRDHGPSEPPTDKLTENGRQWLVRHGHLPEREIVTGFGPVAVRCPAGV